MRRLMTPGLATILLASMLIVPATPAHACSVPMPTRDIADYRGMTFTALVTRVNDLPGKLARIRLRPLRVFAGEVPHPLRITTGDGHGGESCGFFQPLAMREGQQVLISVSGTMPARRGRTFGGFPLIWRRTDHDWRFFKAALVAGDDWEAYPHRARRADTTREILALTVPARARTGAEFRAS